MGQAGDDLPDDGTRRSRKRRLSESSPSGNRKKTAMVLIPARIPSSTHSSTSADTTQDESLTTTSPTTGPASSKPGLTLLDLPTELRLEVYDYLFDDLLMHIYSRRTATRARLCYSSNACANTTKSSLLCKYPAWILTKRSCDHEHPEKKCINRLAFTFTCRRIYQETSLMLYSRPTFHISHEFLVPFLGSLKHSQRNAIQHLTVTGPFMGGRRAISNAADALSEARRLLPGLRRIAFQIQISGGLMAGNSLEPGPRWRSWQISQVLLDSRSGGVQQVLLETTSMIREPYTHFIVFRAGQEAKEWLSNQDSIQTNADTFDEPDITTLELKKHWPF